MIPPAPIHRIVLTGGPCGGKSTALERISERMTDMGFDVYRVPEAATIVLGGGAQLHRMSPGQAAGFQAQLLHVILTLEDAFQAIALGTGRPSILLCYDRNAHDGRRGLPFARSLVGAARRTQFLHRAAARPALRRGDSSRDGSRRRRTVLHDRQQCGAQRIAREGPRARPACAQRLGRPSDAARVIDNATDFAGKIDRVIAAVSAAVGVPPPGAVKRQFRIRKSPPPSEFPTHSELFDIEQTELAATDGTAAHIRRRGQNGAYLYTHTVIREQPDGTRVESERQIGGREYAGLLAQADSALRPIRKKRRVFVWANRYFELDMYIEPWAGLEVLHVEARGRWTRKWNLPPFLDIGEGSDGRGSEHRKRIVVKANATE